MGCSRPSNASARRSCALWPGEARLKEASDAAQSGVLLKVSVLEGDATIAEAKHTLGSLEDQIADQTNSFNDLVGLPIETGDRSNRTR